MDDLAVRVRDAQHLAELTTQLCAANARLCAESEALRVETKLLLDRSWAAVERQHILNRAA